MALNFRLESAEISIIIPAYNRAGLIGDTLRGLLNQTVPAREIIVVDDGSQDGTAEAAEQEFSVFSEQFSAKSSIQNPTFKILRQANAGPGAARNRGLAESTGEFIHFFDSDDIVAPNKHEVQLRALLETGADIAYGPWCKGRFLPLEKLKHGKADRLKEDLTTKIHENTRKGEKQGGTQGTCAGAAFSNPSTSELARDIHNTSLIRSADGPSEALEARRLTLDSGPWNFVPEGPVLQARGLPKGDLVQALLTNWSIVPHACLFRRSILEKAGGFPEDIWVGEDQLLFLRCLLAGAKVVHTPGTMVFYRVGNDPGKLTATGAAQKRHARDWAKFLLKANQEVTSGQCRVARVEEKKSTTIERQGGRENRKLGKAEGRATESWPQRGAASGTMQVKEQPKVGPKGEGVGTTESNHTNLHEKGDKVSTTIERLGGREKEQPKVGPKGERVGTTESNDSDIHGCQKSQPGDAQGTCAGASEPDSLTSNLFDSPVSESLTRSASGPAEAAEPPRTDREGLISDSAEGAKALDSGHSTLGAATPPAEWYAFRLRAYEAWRDLEKFFPDGESEVKNELQGIWKRDWFSVFSFQFSGFVLRKWGGLINRIFGHRVKGCFRPGKFTSREATLFDNR